MKAAKSISLMVSLTGVLIVLLQAHALATTYSGSITNLGITDPTAFANATIKGVSNAYGSQSTSLQERGLTLSWTVTSVGSDWEYDYTLTGGAKAVDKYVTNFDLGTLSGFSPSDIISWSAARASATGGGDPSPGITLVDVSAPSASTTNFSASSISENNNLKTITSGIQWHIIGAPQNTVQDYNSTMFTLSFVSDVAPTWGDFLVYSGTSSGAGAPLAWDSQFSIPTTAVAANGNDGGYVLIPGASSVPIPPSVLLLAGGLGTLGLIRRRKVKK